MTKNIKVNPRGSAFDMKCVNESEFEYEMRFKSCECSIVDGVGEVYWESQDSRYSSEAFDDEIVRAFKANGLERGDKINVEYSCRSFSDSDRYVLTVNWKTPKEVLSFVGKSAHAGFSTTCFNVFRRTSEQGASLFLFSPNVRTGGLIRFSTVDESERRGSESTGFENRIRGRFEDGGSAKIFSDEKHN